MELENPALSVFRMKTIIHQSLKPPHLTWYAKQMVGTTLNTSIHSSGLEDKT